MRYILLSLPEVLDGVIAKHLLLAFFSCIASSFFYELSWDHLQTSGLYQILVSQSASRGTQTEQLVTEETKEE